MTDRLEVGRVARSHGLRGDVIISFVTDRVAERTAVGAQLEIGERTYSVSRAQTHQKQWLVHLDGVNDRESADLLRGKLIHAEPLDDADALFVHELIGQNVVDQHGTDHGRVAAVIANPASDLLELSGGGLIPMVFVLGHGDGVIEVDVPAGLLDGD